MDRECRICGVTKDINDFYKHPQGKDGHDTKCKECAKEMINRNRKNNIEYYREYDRKRGNRQTREYTVEYRNKYPNKYKAQNMVGNAIRDKKLFKKDCESCGSKENIHAHHDDYLEPLNVRWLCAACHHQWHAKHGEAKNGK